MTSLIASEESWQSGSASVARITLLDGRVFIVLAEGRSEYEAIEAARKSVRFALRCQ